MSDFHKSAAWMRLARKVRARTVLPATCVGCGGVINYGEKYDIGHILDASLYPHLALSELNVGPQHRGENRRAGGRLGAQRTNRYRKRRKQGEFPDW